MGVLDAASRQYLEAAVTGDRSSAASVAARLLAAGHDPGAILTDVLAAAQAEIGQRWQEGRCTIGHEHIVTGITEAIVGSLTVGFEPPADRGHLVLTCAEGEVHGLPARFAAELLTLQGWRVTFLGPPTPAAELVRTLESLDADVIGVSCTVPANLVGAARSIAAARATGLPVVAGGAAFGVTAHRARHLGATAWAGTLDHPLDLELVSWCAPLPPPHGPWEDLEADRAELVEEALANLSVLHPPLTRERPGALTDPRGDLDLLLRVTAGAMACDDPSLIDEHVSWLVGLHRADGLLATTERWHGVTYAQDKPQVKAAIQALVAAVRAAVPAAARALAEARSLVRA